MIISSSFIKMTTISRLIIIHNFQFFEKQNKKIGKYARSPWPVSEFYRVFNELLQILKELFQSLNEFFQVLNEPIWKFLHDLFQILTRSSPFLFFIFLIIQKWGNEGRKSHLFYFFLQERIMSLFHILRVLLFSFNNFGWIMKAHRACVVNFYGINEC